VNKEDGESREREREIAERLYIKKNEKPRDTCFVKINGRYIPKITVGSESSVSYFCLTAQLLRVPLCTILKLLK
jgi:hypothetical protein